LGFAVAYALYWSISIILRRYLSERSAEERGIPRYLFFLCLSLAIASHVLEHLPISYLDDASKEIARVARYALIYLPVHGRHMQLRLIPGFKGIDISLIFNLFNYFKKPDGVVPRYMAGMHYWEIGMRGWCVRDVAKRFSRYFQIQASYRNKDWLSSYNFILKSKALANQDGV
jgi:hypothetical protein